MRYLLIMLLLISCGRTKDRNTLVLPPEVPAESSTETTPEVVEPEAPIIPQELILYASRDYNPSVFNPQTGTIIGTGTFIVPDELIVVSSNSNAGTGWASLIISDRKFCYQGNASNANTMNGSKFLLKHESVLTEECHLKVIAKPELDSEIELKDKDSATLSVHGGGVSASIRGFIEVIAQISPK